MVSKVLYGFCCCSTHTFFTYLTSLVGCVFVIQISLPTLGISMYTLMHHLAGPGLPMMKLLGATPISQENYVDVGNRREYDYSFKVD